MDPGPIDRGGEWNVCGISGFFKRLRSSPLCRYTGVRNAAAEYARIAEASPTSITGADTWRVRCDTVDADVDVDADEAITLRHGGRLLHLGIGRAHARTEIIALARSAH